jgi:uncharacterized protein (TIGR00661 family)
MGHATRSRVVLEHLLGAGHEVRVVVSGRAHAFLTERLKQYPNVSVEEIHGFRLRYRNNRLDKSGSLYWTLRNAPRDIAKNLKVYRRVAEEAFRPEVVISDFESWAALYGLNHFVPVISIDNIQIISRCRHRPEVTSARDFTKTLTRVAVQLKLPGVSHFLITSFFFPEVLKKRTTLVPPILRPEIIAAKREPGQHVLVYQTSETNETLIPTLQQLPHPFRVYGMGRVGEEGNVTLRAFSEAQFIDDLRTARAVIAGGGFTLMSEAVSLHVPMLSVPIEQQYEQELNARYLEHLGYGAYCQKLDADTIAAFLARTDEHAHALESYVRRDNSMTLSCVDEVLRRSREGENRPKRLATPALGKWEP